MKYKTHIIAAFLTLLFVPVSAFAQAAPSPVTGVQAQRTDGEVVVSWDAVTSDPIEYYRVYYSEESILNNDGLYDDFEVTEGGETSLTLVPPSGTDMLYVAVIAVAQNGLESEFFTEEASVDLAGVVSPPPTPAPAMDGDAKPPVRETETEQGAAKLLKGSVPSPTQMVIEFSAPMTVEASEAPTALKIEAPGGKRLQIKNITIKGKTITINTETQTKGTVYNVKFSEPFMGKAGQKLDLDDRSVLLTGHSDGNEPKVAPPVREVNPMAPPDLENVTIVPELQENGGYTVTLRWDIDNTPGDLYGIVAYQTRDGQTFGPPSLLPIDIGGVQLIDVTPGFFGIYLQTVNVYGYVSPGVFQYVTLPIYIPGYGFYGSLTYGGTQEDAAATGDTENETDDLATLAVITEDTPTKKIDGVDHSAAYEESLPINWTNAALLAGSVAVLVILIVGGVAMFAKKNGSADL